MKTTREDRKRNPSQNVTIAWKRSTGVLAGMQPYIIKGTPARPRKERESFVALDEKVAFAACMTSYIRGVYDRPASFDSPQKALDLLLECPSNRAVRKFVHWIFDQKMD